MNNVTRGLIVGLLCLIVVVAIETAMLIHMDYVLREYPEPSLAELEWYQNHPYLQAWQADVPILSSQDIVDCGLVDQPYDDGLEIYVPDSYEPVQYVQYHGLMYVTLYGEPLKPHDGTNEWWTFVYLSTDGKNWKLWDRHFDMTGAEVLDGLR